VCLLKISERGTIPFHGSPAACSIVPLFIFPIGAPIQILSPRYHSLSFGPLPKSFHTVPLQILQFHHIARFLSGPLKNISLSVNKTKNCICSSEIYPYCYLFLCHILKIISFYSCKYNIYKYIINNIRAHLWNTLV